MGRALAPAGGVRATGAQFYALLFAGAVAAFCLSKLVGNQYGTASDVLGAVGGATCGWSWLLARALFRRPGAHRQRWSLAIVVGMVLVDVALRFEDGNTGPLLRVASNTEGLTSSALLLLATIEPLRGIGDDIPRSEKRFRVGFAVCYAILLTIAVLLIDGAPTDSAAARFGGGIKATCALVALAGMVFAIWYRAGHPLPQVARIKRRPSTSCENGLDGRILQIVCADAAFAQPDLKVADLARRVGEAEYKVTQCVTGVLGFRNFNQMANHFRVAEVKRRLSDPLFNHLPILTIALDCGFGSIGPFNRAFRDETGMTPTQYRKTHNVDNAGA